MQSYPFARQQGYEEVRFSNFMEVNGQIHASAPLPPVNVPPVHRGAGGSTVEPVWKRRKKRKFLSVLEMEPRFLGCPSHNIVFIWTEESS